MCDGARGSGVVQCSLFICRSVLRDLIKHLERTTIIGTSGCRRGGCCWSGHLSDLSDLNCDSWSDKHGVTKASVTAG